MKRLLSVILSAVIIFTLALPAFAADSNTQPLKGVETKLKSDETATCTVKTDKEGIYYIDLYSERSALLAVNVYNGDKELYSGIIITSDVKDRIILGDKRFFKADENTELTVYLFNIDLLNTGINDLSVMVTPVYCGNSELSMGENQVESEASAFRFIPEEDGYYSFESNAPKNIDPFVSVADAFYYPDQNDDNELDGDMNFSLTVYLEKGQEYIVAVTAQTDSDSEFTPFSFTVSLNKTFDIKKVSFGYYENGETIKTYKGVDNSSMITLAPTGALYELSDITVSVDDEKIASVDVDDFGYVTVHPHKLGKTTLTITCANGCEAQYTIKVRPYIFWLFNRFFNFISSLLGF